jgi:hypothetical protein
MVNYTSGDAFQAKMAAKLAALNGEPVVPQTVPEAVAQILAGEWTLGPVEVGLPVPLTPLPSVDTNVSTWSLEEKSAALAFWDRWNVNGKIECDCPDVLCRRAQALNAATVPF